MRQGLERERALVDALTDKARGLLSERGELAPATLERVSDTLHAAALDPDARQQVSDGSLERELRRVGLGTAGLSAAPAAPKRTPGRAKGEANGKRAAHQADRQRAEEQRAEEQRAAKRAETQARRAAEKAERGLEAAQRRRDAAAEALRVADEALASARAGAKQAAIEHRRAQRALGGA